jgi:hypothetical protein
VSTAAAIAPRFLSDRTASTAQVPATHAASSQNSARPRPAVARESCSAVHPAEGRTSTDQATSSTRTAPTRMAAPSITRRQRVSGWSSSDHSTRSRV